MLKEERAAAASASWPTCRRSFRDREVRVDERRLRQVLFNLLSNAIKFTPG